MKRSFYLSTMLILVVITGCIRPPSTFVRTFEPGFKEIQLKPDLQKDECWNAVVDILTKKFDIEVLEKKDNYLRTGWAHYTTGKLDERYRVRVTCKFSDDYSKLTIKTEAQWMTNTGWSLGYDIAVLQDVTNDITGKIGRVIK